MFGANSNINPYSSLQHASHGYPTTQLGGHGHSHGDHGGHGHSHGDMGGHGHSQGLDGGCETSSNVGQNVGDFPSPGPLDKPKVAPPKTAKPQLETMTIVQAVQYGEMAKLQQFVADGSDVRQPDDENVTLLHWAAINNRIEIVK